MQATTVPGGRNWPRVMKSIISSKLGMIRRMGSAGEGMRYIVTPLID